VLESIGVASKIATYCGTMLAELGHPKIECSHKSLTLLIPTETPGNLESFVVEPFSK